MSDSRAQTLDALANVPTAMLAGFQSDMTVEAALKVVAALTERIEGKAESPPAFSTAFLAAAGKKPSSSCHEAAADAMGELSRKYDVGAEVKRYAHAIRLG